MAGSPHVLVIQHVALEGSGAIGAALRARGLEERVVRVDRGDAVPPDPGGARGLLLMGGPMGVYEADRLPHLHDEMGLVRAAVAAGAPVLGVCLGSQLVAAALGARVERAPRREVGWHEVRLAPAARDDVMFSGCPASFVPLHWHGDVFGLPPGAMSLASSRQTEHQAFRYGTSTWGVLFHMEMDASQAAGMAADFADDLRDAGVSREDVVDATARFTEVAPIASRAFGAWAQRVAQPAR
jgi:GMP synthase (glutamine-hydrolysing)